MFLEWLYDSTSSISAFKSPVVIGVCGALLSPISLLLVWRLWAFTIKPLLRANEPRELPYWIPYLGHAIEYVKNGQGVINTGREYFNNTREPFAITLGGEKLYFLVSPDDVSNLYKNTTSLAFDEVVYELSITFGVSGDAMDKVYHRPTNEADDVVSQKLQIKNPRLKSLAQLNNDFWKEQLVPGEIYYALQENFLRYIDKSLHCIDNSAKYVVSSNMETGEKTVSLLRWTQEVLLDAALRAFFGDQILVLEPDLPNHFLEFDDDNWKLWYKWPNAKKMHTAKFKVIKTLIRYLALPKEERPGAAYIVETMETTQRALGTSEEDIAKILCMVVFVTNTNTYKVLFWALAHLLHDPMLLSTVREETATAVRPDAPLSLPYIMDSCPWLSALFHEALRVCSASSSIRFVTTPTSIGGKELPAGSRVIVPFRQLHFDSNVYGPDVDDFAPERFIRSKTLMHSSSYRPFGGGISYCPGRFIARHEVGVFVTLVLARFKVEVAGDMKMPELDAEKPTTGLMSPKPGEDVLLKLTPRLL